MAQPSFVPLNPADRVRASERLPVPDAWRPDRPGDLTRPGMPSGPGFGSPGPDSGYGLKLARHFVPRLRLEKGEHAEDAVAGCFAVASKRAAMFGRAPVIHDFELAYALFGFLDVAPPDLLAFRKPLFQAAAEHYADQRKIVDLVRETTLRMTPAMVRERLNGWRDLLDV
jgi:hypothetical protein